MHHLRSLGAKVVVGGTIAAAAAFGLAACGSSSSKTVPANPASATNPSSATTPNTPAPPAPTNAPTGGGVSY